MRGCASRLGRKLQTWFVRTSDTTEVSDWRRLRDGLFALALALGPLELPMFWRWLLWLGCWGVIVGIVLPDWFPVFHQFPAKSKRLVFVMAMLVFVVSFYRTAHSQWRAERAADMQGYLIVRNPMRLKYPHFQIAGSCAVLIGYGPLILFKDAELRFSLSPQGSTEITTTVEDREGHRIVEINENHWVVYEGAGDKNYTRDSLEVLDKGGHVVLQVRLFPDRASLWGEWHNEFGQAAQLTECPNPNEHGEIEACVALFGPALPEKTSKVHIEPIFKYPSKDHWGEFTQHSH